LGGSLEGDYISFPELSIGGQLLHEIKDDVMQCGLSSVIESGTLILMCNPCPFIKRILALAVLKDSQTQDELSVLFSHLTNTPKAMEIYIAYECCHFYSPLYSKIFQGLSGCLPTELKSNEINYKMESLPSNATNLSNAFVVRDNNTYITGKHKIDVVVPYNKGNIYFQCTIKDDDAKINRKIIKTFSAFANQDAAHNTATICIFVSLKKFAISGDAAKLIEKLNNEKEKAHYKVLQGTDFDGCIFPFDILKNKGDMVDPAVKDKALSIFFSKHGLNNINYMAGLFTKLNKNDKNDEIDASSRLLISIRERSQSFFKEIELQEKSYKELLFKISKKFNRELSEIVHVIKLPNIIIESDEDTKRLKQNQELEVNFDIFD